MNKEQMIDPRQALVVEKVHKRLLRLARQVRPLDADDEFLIEVLAHVHARLIILDCIMARVGPLSSAAAERYELDARLRDAVLRALGFEDGCEDDDEGRRKPH